MDAAAVHPGAIPRSRWRAYLLLARVSNLPTVWSNVLAGTVGGAVTLAGTAPDPLAGLGPGGVIRLVAAASLFYTGGMFLNDAFDAPFDRAARPERPIPRGDVGLGEAFAVGAACLALGEALLWPSRLAMALGALLAAAIVFYDVRHKGNRVAPVVMGACRGLVYAIAAAGTGLVPGLRAVPGLGLVSVPVLVGAVVMTIYVAGLTVVAKRAGANARSLVPVLIAGISLVDAAFILVVSPSNAPLALLAAIGFPLTLFLQRWVPGD